MQLYELNTNECVSALCLQFLILLHIVSFTESIQLVKILTLELSSFRSYWDTGQRVVSAVGDLLGPVQASFIVLRSSLNVACQVFVGFP